MIRKRITYANVMSSLAVFAVLAGGTAFAANQLAKNSVGAKQLKKNAVTTAKIKKNAVTTAKIKKNAVTTAKIKAGAVATGKIKDGAVTGPKINAGSTPFGQVTAKLRAPGPFAFGGPPSPILVGTYAQPAGETDQYVGGLTVTFDPACTAPREAVAYLSRNPQTPAAPSEGDNLAIGVVLDKTGASPTHKLEFASFPLTGGSATTSFEPTATENQTFYVYLLGVECTAGSEVASASNIGVNVIGTK